MNKIGSVQALEKFGRIRLSKSFFMRDFLYSDISNIYGTPNIPDDPDLAIMVGKMLCQQLLEPLNATFGRIAIRSAYRSCAVNELGHSKGHNCAANEKNHAGHIWDRRDAQGLAGATACIVIPWFSDRYEQGADWRAMAYWIHDHLPYSEMQFFPNLAAFNISWHEIPKQRIYSYIEPRGQLDVQATSLPDRQAAYSEFPNLAADSEYRQ